MDVPWTSLRSAPHMVRDMKTSFVTTVSLVGILATGGAAFAANNSALDSLVSDVTSSTTIPPTSTTTVAPTQTQSVYDIPGVGIITLNQDAAGIEILSVNLASGWTYDAENDHATEIEVEFENGDQNVKFRAELIDGLVVIAVEADEHDADENEADDDADEADDDDADEADDDDDEEADDDDDDNDDDDDDDDDDDEADDEADEVDND